MKKWNLTLAARIVAGVLFMIFAMGTLLGAGACVEARRGRSRAARAPAAPPGGRAARPSTGSASAARAGRRHPATAPPAPGPTAARPSPPPDPSKPTTAAPPSRLCRGFLPSLYTVEAGKSKCNCWKYGARSKPPWITTAAFGIPDAVRNIVTTIATGGVAMVIIFAIDKTIFAPGFGEKK